jgi:hypothetical protein
MLTIDVRAMPAPPIRDDDDLGDLPPLDGDLHEEQEEEAGTLEDLPAEGDASLDDTTGEAEPLDPADLELQSGEEGWLDEPNDAPDLNLGTVALADLAEERDSLEDVEEPGVGDEDFGLGSADASKDELDAGDEGPLDEDDALREEDLPQLDADDEGTLEDAALVEAGFAADEPPSLRWAAEPWPRVGAPVDLLSASAVACAGRGAMVAGRTEEGAAELVRVDLEGTSQSLSAAGLNVAGVCALAVDGDRVVALVEGGRILLSRDGGVRFAPALEGVVAAGILLVGGALWVRAAGGVVLRCANVGVRLQRGSTRGTAAAIAADIAGAVWGLVADDAGRVRALADLSSREPSDDVTVGERSPSALPDARMPAVLAVRGEHAAYAGRRGIVRRLASRAWETHVWEGRVAGLAFLDDAGTLVAATCSDSDDTTALVRLDAEGVATIVARIGPAGSHRDSDAGVLDVAYDDTRGVVWVAGAFGVAAFAVR